MENFYLKLKYSVKLLRPKQWIKNFFVFASLIFSGNLLRLDIFKINFVVFLLFCLTSSCVYILNDIVDAEKDKCHPEKKYRPIASGLISKVHAGIMGVFILLVIIYTSYRTNLSVLGILFIYLILNIFYSFKLKNIVIIDVMVITLGFVLRVESGSLATNVHLSPWLILCTILLSLFLALNKRKSEIISLNSKGKNHRKILEEYSVELIDKMLTIVIPSILMAYCLYTFNSTQSKAMMLTIPFILYGIFRYEYLMTKKNIGGKPEDIFVKDIAFLVNIILWVLTVLAIIYFNL